MKSIDIKAFRKSNDLTQTDLGDYLGCTKAFISAIEKGLRPLPDEMYSKLIDNPNNWDTSMLTQPENPMTDEPKDGTLDFVIRYMARQIEELQAKFDNLEAEYKEVCQERDDLIERNHELEKILARKGEIARVVTGSSDASAV